MRILRGRPAMLLVVVLALYLALGGWSPAGRETGVALAQAPSAQVKDEAQRHGRQLASPSIIEREDVPRERAAAPPEQEEPVPGDEGIFAEFGRVLAGLGVFFAVMAIVAVGTEVLAEALKVAVGLKNKVTAIEALDRLQEYLPGDLETLGVSPAAREQFSALMREMRDVLDDVLQYTQDVASLRAQVAGSRYGDAYRRADALLPEQGDIAAENLSRFKKDIKVYVNNVLSTAENRFDADADVVRLLRNQLSVFIANYDGRNPGDFLDSLFSTLQDAHFWSVQIADGWLNQQLDIFFDNSSTAVMARFERDVQPLLMGVGFAPDAVAQIGQSLLSRLRIIEQGVSQTADAYVKSLRNLLDAVELRRYETQSPARKIWRALRQWQGGTFPATHFTAVVAQALLIALAALFVTYLVQPDLVTAPDGLPQSFLPEGWNLPWLVWFIIFFVLAYAVILGVYLAGRARGETRRAWLHGLYGTIAMAALVGLFVLFVVWLLQPAGLSIRTSGQLYFAGAALPVWTWFIAFFVTAYLLLILIGELGAYIYGRLIKSAAAADEEAPAENKLAGATVLLKVETLWNLLRRGFDVRRVDPEKFDQPTLVEDYETWLRSRSLQDTRFSAETLAQYILQRTDQQRDEEISRLRWLRVVSIALALVIAYYLQVDALRLLSDAFPGLLDGFNFVLISGDSLHTWRSWLSPERAITVGIVLTAFAASAGSTYWHDRLDQLQAAKQRTKAITDMLNQTNQVMENLERQPGR